MCNFASFVITKTGKVYGDGSVDNHESIIEKAKLKDDKQKQLLGMRKSIKSVMCLLWTMKKTG